MLKQMGPPANVMQMKQIRFAHRMTAQDIWARKFHELWEKLEKNTRDSFCTALWKWLVRILQLLLLNQCKNSSCKQYNNCRLGVRKRGLTQSFTQSQSVSSFWRTCSVTWLPRSQKIHLAQSEWHAKLCPRSGDTCYS